MVASASEDDQTRSFAALAAGIKVSHYTIISKIGAGGMGEVYLAEDNQLGRKVAVKFLPSHLSQDQAARARFTREAKAAAKLDHPNIVQVFEVGEFQGRPFFAMAHIEGKSLRDVIKKGNLSVNEAIELTKQICEGLRRAHESGVVHRDIKPGNIIIDGDNKVRILDFGLATISGEDKLTRTGSTLGTVGYMSPEQIEGKHVDRRSDLFSVGVILYEMLTGRRPFEGDTDAAVARSITDALPEPIARYKSGTTGELQQIVDKALSKAPSLRYQHADGMLADLKRLQIGESSPRKSRASLWMAVVAVGIIAIAAYYVSTRLPVTSNSDEPGWSNSIAVLVFRDLSPDKDQDWFCEGMTDEIINRLHSVKELKTISIQSVLRFKESASELQEIAKELSVDNVLIGSIQPDGDSIRVRTQLIRVDDETSLWSERFERARDGVFSVQDEIASSIAEALKIELTSEQTGALVEQGTKDIEAYNAYLQGQFFWRKRNEADLYRALEKFETATWLDPYYAKAYSGIADVWNVLPQCSNLSTTEVMHKAKEAAQKALELDDRLAEAHASIGLVHLFDLEIEKAEEALLKAMELNPNYPWAHVWYAGIYSDFKSDYDRAMKHLEIALQLDPLSTVALHNIAMIKKGLGKHSESLDYLRKAVEIEPNNINWLGQLAFEWTWLQEKDSALYYAEQTVELEPDNWRSRHYYGEILGGYGDYEGAKEQLRLACELSPNNYVPLQTLGIFYMRIPQDYETAISYLERAVEVNSRAFEAYNALAYGYAAVGSYAPAVKAVTKAIELAPFQPAYIDSRADIHATFGRLQEAIDDYLLFLKTVPGSFPINETLNELIGVALHAEDYELADSILSARLADAKPASRPWAKRNLARTLRYRGKFRQYVDKMQEWISEEADSLGDHWQTYATFYEMAVINMYYLNQIDSALAQLNLIKEMAWRIDSTHYRNVLASGRIAEAHAISGNESAARQTLSDCWESMDSAKSINTYWWYGALVEYRLGNYDSALTLIHKTPFTGFYVKDLIGCMHLAAGRVDSAVSTLEEIVLIYDQSRLTTNPERSVLGHYHLGQAYEAAGRTLEAIEQYETFLDIWRNADRGLESVGDARKRLARLKESI
jgi:serine/threonine protein kinase/tetratricopeptide (TPR) repeat protein